MYSKDYYLIAINPWHRWYYNVKTDKHITVTNEQYEQYIQSTPDMSTPDNKMGDLKFTTAGEYMESFEHNQ